MDFYYGRISGNSSRAAFGLFEAGVAFTPHLLDPRSGGNKTAAYLAVNPMGKIPALAHGAFRLWESNAINWYAAESNPAAKLIPQTAEGRASMQRWLFFQSAHVSPAAVPLFRATNPRIQAFWGTSPDEKVAEASRVELRRYLPVLEAALEGRDWLERDFTLADIAYAPHFMLMAGGGFDFGPWPRVAAWLERTLARPGWKKTADLIFAE